MISESRTAHDRTLSAQDEARVAEVAAFLTSSTLETLQLLCERVAEDEATFARLAGVVRNLSHDSLSTDEESFLARARRLDTHRETDAALDLVYNGFDELFRAAQWETADRLLANATPASLSDALLVGILTATLPAKSRLPARTMFYEDAEHQLTERRSVEPGMLAGLEP